MSLEIIPDGDQASFWFIADMPVGQQFSTWCNDHGINTAKNRYRILKTARGTFELEVRGETDKSTAVEMKLRWKVGEA